MPSNDSMRASAEALASPRSAAEQKCRSRPSAMRGAAKASSTEPATKLVGKRTHADRDERTKGSTPNGLATSTRPATKPSATHIAPVILSIGAPPEITRDLRKLYRSPP